MDFKLLILWIGLCVASRIPLGPPGNIDEARIVGNKGNDVLVGGPGDRDTEATLWVDETRDATSVGGRDEDLLSFQDKSKTVANDDDTSKITLPIGPIGVSSSSTHPEVGAEVFPPSPIGIKCTIDKIDTTIKKELPIGPDGSSANCECPTEEVFPPSPSYFRCLMENEYTAGQYELPIGPDGLPANNVDQNEAEELIFPPGPFRLKCAQDHTASNNDLPIGPD